GGEISGPRWGHEHGAGFWYWRPPPWGERAAPTFQKSRWGGGSKQPPAQGPAGLLADLGDDLRGDRLDFLICQGVVARLQRDRNGDRLLPRLDALALVQVEHVDATDQLAVDRLRRAHDVGCLDGAVHHEGEFEVDRPE